MAIRGSKKKPRKTVARLPKLARVPRSHGAKTATGLAIVQGIIGTITAIWNAKRSLPFRR
jgi:hypothetical protein